MSFAGAVIYHLYFHNFCIYSELLQCICDYSILHVYLHSDIIQCDARSQHVAKLRVLNAREARSQHVAKF